MPWFWSSSAIEKQLRRIAFRAAKPLFLNAYPARKESDDMDLLVYQVTAAPPVDHDVVERRLTVTIGGESVVKSYPGDTTDFGEAVTSLEGAEVQLALVDVDNAGNQSEPALVEFVATDTLPPQRPEFGVTLVREEKAETPTVVEDEDEGEPESESE